MSIVIGVIEEGLIYAIMALGLYIPAKKLINSAADGCTPLKITMAEIGRAHV